MMKIISNFFYFICIHAFCLITASGVSAEIVTTTDDQKSISLTVYNDNLALVRDVRNIFFVQGEQTLAFKEISSQVLPETALLRGDNIEVIEQNFEFDLLSPTSLLNKYIGKQVTLVKTNIKTGKEEHVPATVLSTTEGVVLKIGNHIETWVDGHLIYPDVPDNLRERPTLTMVLDSAKKADRKVELFYLTRGLSWGADYVAELNREENRLNIKGWVTLINNSGASYRKAKLQLVAGDVNRARVEEGVFVKTLDSRSGGINKKKRSVSRETMFEYHLYTVARPVTIKENQSKQIALLQENNGVCTKQLVLKAGTSAYYLRKTGEISKKRSVDVFLEFKNDKASNFGQPKPAGIVRVYQKDSAGFSQFIGEDNIGHTPENEMVRVKMGKAFDVTADRVQTAFSFEKRAIIGTRIYESEYEVKLKNAKDSKVNVKVLETIPGNWQILSESVKHKKESATTVSWKVSVAAKSSKVLKYRVKTEI